MRQVACPNCGRLALLPDDGPARCMYCGADLPPAPVDQPAGTMPGMAPAAPGYPQSAPLPPGAAVPPGYLPSYPLGHPPTYPPPGYAPPPTEYYQAPPGYGVAPPGYGPISPDMPGAAPVDPRMQPAPGYPYGYPAYPPSGPNAPNAPYPYPYPGPTPYPYGYPGGPAAQPTAPVRRRRRWLLVSAIVLLVVLLVGGGGAAAVIAAQSGQQGTQPTASAPTTAPTVAVTVPSGFTIYQDPTGLFAMAVPSGWQQLSSSSGGYSVAQFADPTQHASITVEYTDTSNFDEQQFDDQILKQLTASLPGATLTDKKTLPQIFSGNNTWASEGADLTFTSGDARTTLHAIVQTTSQAAQQGNGANDFLFATLFVAPSDSFASLDTRYFQPAQLSFKFAPQ